MVNVQEALKSHFEKKQKEHEHYSLRLLAKRTGISPSYLSLIFSGKRKLQLKYLEPICNALDLDRETRNEIYFYFIKENADNKAQRVYENSSSDDVSQNASFSEVAPQSRKSFNILTPWYNLAVLDATLLKDFDGSAKWITEKLNLTEVEVEEAIDKLLEAGLLEVNDGKYKKFQEKIEFRSFQSPEALRSHHDEFLDVARNVLHTRISSDDMEERLISGMTFAVSSQMAQKIKSRLNNLLYEVLREAEQDSDTSEVYRLSFQFFPIK